MNVQPCLAPLCFNTQSAEDCLANSRCTGRVLAGDQSSSSSSFGFNHLLTPRLVSLDVPTTGNPVEFILEHKRHEGGQLDLVFLCVGETSHLSTREQRFSGALSVDEDNGSVADSRDGLLGIGEGVNQFYGCLILDQVKHGLSVSINVSQ